MCQMCQIKQETRVTPHSAPPPEALRCGAMGVRVDGLSRLGTPHAAARLPRRRCGNMRARRIHQVVVGLVLVVQMLDDLRVAVDDAAAPARQRGQAAGERLQIGLLRVRVRLARVRLGLGSGQVMVGLGSTLTLTLTLA